jgi:hypothetical protein
MKVATLSATFYMLGILGTFAWVFLSFSGPAACHRASEVCETVVLAAGQTALGWPLYWGTRVTSVE